MFIARLKAELIYIIGLYSIILVGFNAIFFSYAIAYGYGEVWKPSLEILVILNIVGSWLIIEDYYLITIGEYSKIRIMTILISQIVFEILMAFEVPVLSLFEWIFFTGSFILIISVIGIEKETKDKNNSVTYHIS